MPPAVRTEQNVPPYVIFHDATLKEMAALRPADPAALLVDRRRRTGEALALRRAVPRSAASLPGACELRGVQLRQVKICRRR